jgi:hypothetical protein
MREKSRFLNIVLPAIALFIIAGVAFAVSAGFTTNTGEQLQSSQKTDAILDCSEPNGIFCDDFESGGLRTWSDFPLTPCQVPDVELPVQGR